MINDFPIEIREKINNFTKKHDKAFKIKDHYNFNETAINQGFTPEYLSFEVDSIISEFSEIQKITSPYLPSNITSSQFEINIQDSVLIALSTLLRLISVITIENPEQKDKLDELYKKYSKFIEQDRYRIHYKMDYCSSIYSDIDPCDVLQDWDTVFISVCSEVDRIAGNIELLYKLDAKYKFENKEDIRLDELIPCNLSLLDEKEKGEFLKTALHPEYFLDKRNLIDFNSVNLSEKPYCNSIFIDPSPWFRDLLSSYVDVTKIGKNFDYNEFWDMALENANFILNEENISLISPRLIQMALEIKYGQYA